ncbi:MAG: redoxin domain-containing protein [Chloroflexi bacterium]|nr:redoxin domain-containing protein [Chloroflexota bacterium]MDA1270721.1 redoxin domain-containing protein [Chloroflexota bacterium]
MEAPALGRAQREFQSQGVQVLAINTAAWVSVEEWRDYWHSKGAEDVTWANDTGGRLVKEFGVTSLGTTIILDRNGLVSYRDGGATSYDVLKTEIERTL